MHTKDIGDIAEAKCIAKALELGYIVSIPFGENQAYDLIIDNKSKLKRIQVKSRSIRTDNTIMVELLSSSNKVSYIGRADEVWIYCPDNNEIYQIDLKIIIQRSITLRFKIPDRNYNNSRYAEDYLVK